MSDQLLFVLKLCLLALLYLFFFRVVRAVWAELRTPSPVVGSTGVAGVPAAAPSRRDRKARAKAARSQPQLVVTEPPDQAGRSYPLENEVSIGRAAGCQITLDDTYSSQIHARVFTRDGQWLVEDLGSTNGTFLNDRRVGKDAALKVHDSLRIGQTTLRYEE